MSKQDNTSSLATSAEKSEKQKLFQTVRQKKKGSGKRRVNSNPKTIFSKYENVNRTKDILLNKTLAQQFCDYQQSCDFETNPNRGGSLFDKINYSETASDYEHLLASLFNLLKRFDANTLTKLNELMTEAFKGKTEGYI